MKRGFTLIEIITVLAIMAIGMGIFYSVLFVNWSSFQKQLTLIDFQMEADEIMEMLSFDGKFARQFTLTQDAKQVTFDFPVGGGNPVTYALSAQGEMQRQVDGVNSVVSENIDYNNSSFSRVGSSLQVDLILNDEVFGKRIEFRVSNQICPRNL